MPPVVEPTERASFQLALDTPVHFVGVGGIGMSGLAKLLAEKGFHVSGSDLKLSKYTEPVIKAGGTLYEGHNESHVPEGAVVVVSTSIREDNPEIKVARKNNLPIVHRSVILREILQGEVFQHKNVMGITGTHGKTSTTGMTGIAIEGGAQTPTTIVGGIVPEWQTNAVLDTTGTNAVAELDESDGSILQYSPSISAITNLELDHAEHFENGLDTIMSIFNTYLNNLDHGSRVLFNVTCPNTKKLYQNKPEHIEAVLVAPNDIFTGKEPETTYWLKNVRMHGHGCYQGYVYKKRSLLGELHLNVPGIHNLANALFAVALGDMAGANFDGMANALRNFSGMGRRFEHVGEFNGGKLIDDYAHHPTEVACTLKAAKEMLKGTDGKLIAVFQPHRYTRLQALWNEFLTAFDLADTTIITDVFSAHEDVIDGVDSASFVSALKQRTEQTGHCHFMATPLQSDSQSSHDFASVVAQLKDTVKPGDIVISMGAGTITSLLRHW